MPRYIKADDLAIKFRMLAEDPWNKDTGTTWSNAYEECADNVDEFPTADVVEVVRCKDCKWWDITDIASTLTPNACRCKRVSRLWMESDAFCAYGERRER